MGTVRQNSVRRHAAVAGTPAELFSKIWTSGLPAADIDLGSIHLQKNFSPEKRSKSFQSLDGWFSPYNQIENWVTQDMAKSLDFQHWKLIDDYLGVK